MPVGDVFDAWLFEVGLGTWSCRFGPGEALRSKLEMLGAVEAVV